jgi:hypothetical protein
VIRPTIAVIATMCLSWGLACVIQIARTSTGEDVVIRCRRCQLPQVAAPSPIVSCKQCGLVQIAKGEGYMYRVAPHRIALESDE